MSEPIIGTGRETSGVPVQWGAPQDHAACNGELTIRQVQHQAWANKVAKGFNTTDVPMEFGLTMEELGEAFSAWRKQRDLGGELADVMIFLAGLAEMNAIDLQAEVERKLARNEARRYERLPNGTPVKAGESR